MHLGVWIATEGLRVSSDSRSGWDGAGGGVYPNANVRVQEPAVRYNSMY